MNLSLHLRPIDMRRLALQFPKLHAAADTSFPGEFPFTRGIQPTMYRGRLWSMRQYAGFGTAQESNARYRYLLGQVSSGLSVAFDLPTQMGYDSRPHTGRRRGRSGWRRHRPVEDMAVLFDGIPLGSVSTSMTINATASILAGCTSRWRKDRACR